MRSAPGQLVLADTSVWVDFFAERASAKIELLKEAIINQKIVMGDLILVELLQGAKSLSLQKLIDSRLSPIECNVLCGAEIAPKAAANYRRLRQRGITVRGTIDVIIATWCIENGVALLHNDRDFLAMEEALGLVSWQPQ